MKYTDRDNLAVLKQSWPNASSKEHKRSAITNEMYSMTRKASDEKLRITQTHKHKRPCGLTKRAGQRPALQNIREAPEGRRCII